MIRPPLGGVKKKRSPGQSSATAPVTVPCYNPVASVDPGETGGRIHQDRRCDVAVLTLDGKAGRVEEGAEMRDFLSRHGVVFDTWTVPASLGPLQGKPSLTDDEKGEVLGAYREKLSAEAAEHGYTQADIVVMSPETPGLHEALAKFDKVHYHDDDEVRCIFSGEGLFGFEPEHAAAFTVTVSAGDYIIVPAKTFHWFTLTDTRSIKALRLFKDPSGWVPHYKDAMG